MRDEDLKVTSEDGRERKGGQHCGLIPMAVKVVHVPTGLTAVCDSGRSQHKSREIAKSMIEWGLSEMKWGGADR